MRLAALSDVALVPDELLAAVAHPRAGGHALFVGTVRDHDHGQAVTRLAYSGHPSAEQVIAQVAGEVAATPEVLAVAVAHRVGDLVVGDVAIVAAVSCAHRGDAFEACRELVEGVKARLPVWKHQVFADGSEEWVGAEGS